MKLPFLFVRAAAGTLAIGTASPVNLPYAVQAQVVETASADAPAHAAVRLVPFGQRDDVNLGSDRDLSRNGDLHQDVRLKVGPHGELPCDSGDWANNSLFGPRAGVMAALGITPTSPSDAGSDAALASALGDKPTGDADSSAFGSVFGNAPSAGNLGDLLGLGGGGTSGTGGQGGGTNIFTGAPISGTITQGGFNTWGANVYGGAGGTGQYATVFYPTTILLSSPVTYAGLWASAIDGDFTTSLGNTVALYSGDTLLGSYALKPALAGTAGAYNGNPNAAYLGQDAGEPFAFFGFTSTTAFDRIDIIENGGGGFELDNITIGNAIGHHGGGDNETAAVPEPASWAMMLVGFGAMGGIMRMRRKTISFA